MTDAPNSGGFFDIDGKQVELTEKEKISQEQNLWNDPSEAQKVMQRISELKDWIIIWNETQALLQDLQALIELAEEAKDESMETEVNNEISEVEKHLSELEIRNILSGEDDERNAILTIHSGAGGTEAQDWAEMLLRMYLRWAERKGFQTEIIDYLPGDEAGLKSVSWTLKGEYAYGYAKAEIGIHRLVRISPFDAGARRHTSFASVFVYPEVDDRIVVEIDEKDLRIDTYRSSGAGGQHVNKTDSAIRITHLPTGIVVQCQNERSQHKNRAMAMKVLKARLYELKVKEQAQKMEDLHSAKKQIAWGSQIRSYILQPYRMVKDHRTNHQTGNVDAVLDGEIEPFIAAYLRYRAKSRNK